MMEFLLKEDFKAVCDNQTLEVIDQADDENLERAERYAREEVASYLRSRYNISSAYALRGDERNHQLVMITCDVALYHLIAWLPKRIGFEIREKRYERAIAWCRDVQAGKATPDIPVLTDESGQDVGTPVSYGGWAKSTYDY